MRRWHIELDCGGTPWVWNGPADSQAEAIDAARAALYWQDWAERARVAVCVELPRAA